MPPTAESTGGRRRRSRRLAVLVVAGLVLGVAVVLLRIGGVPPFADRVSESDLHGKWYVTSLTRPDGASVLPQSLLGYVTVRFGHGWLSSEDGCNTVGGRYHLADHGAELVIGVLSTSLVGCTVEAPMMEELPAVHRVSVDKGGVTLLSEDREVIAVLRRDPSLASSLDGSWVVTALTSDVGRSLLPDEARGQVSVKFDRGRLTGSDGCNDIMGTYQISADGKDFSIPGLLVSTAVGCPGTPPLGERLIHVRHVSADGDRVELLADDRSVIVVLEPTA